MEFGQSLAEDRETIRFWQGPCAGHDRLLDVESMAQPLCTSRALVGPVRCPGMELLCSLVSPRQPSGQGVGGANMHGSAHHGMTQEGRANCCGPSVSSLACSFLCRELSASRLWEVRVRPQRRGSRRQDTEKVGRATLDEVGTDAVPMTAFSWPATVLERSGRHRNP